MAVWQIIWGVIQVVWGLIYGLLKVGLELLAGDWDGAWKAMKQSAQMMWNGIKDIFEGALNYVRAWGMQIVGNMVKPFEDAWNRISEFVNKIKDALDFTKRHSPSVVDIVKHGVGEVNRALGGLDAGMQVAPVGVAGIGMGGGMGTTVNQSQIHINMEGALIGDEYSAMKIGEKLGDAIMKKLNTQIRY
jgi:phage-related protein